VSCRQRDAATHTARLQVGWYIIFMASEGGRGEVVAKRTEERKRADREGRKHQKKEQVHKIEDINILFENFFRPTNVWRPVADAYRKKYHTEYMPSGEGRFLRWHEIMRKANLYESGASDNGLPGVLFPIREPLFGWSYLC
jgi:hypothetical protein